MSDMAIVCTVITAAIELLLMAFAIFCIGFFAGYRRENRKITRKMPIRSEASINKREKKTEKQWKNFLKYDGSAKSDNDNND